MDVGQGPNWGRSAKEIFIEIKKFHQTKVVEKNESSHFMCYRKVPRLGQKEMLA
jgi:hypothetical protein